MERKAIVIGATGLIGKELVGQLINSPDYSRITLLVRRTFGIQHPKLEEKIINFEQLDEVDVNLKEADVFCTLGTTIKKAGSQEAFRLVDYSYPLTVAKVAKEQGASHFLIVTSMGASAKSMAFYSRVKGEIEEALKALNLPALSIFRPSLLLGDREEFRLGERFASVLSTALLPVFKGPLRKVRPVEGRTVATAMVRVATKGEGQFRIFESEEIQKLADGVSIGH